WPFRFPCAFSPNSAFPSLVCRPSLRFLLHRWWASRLALFPLRAPHNWIRWKRCITNELPSEISSGSDGSLSRLPELPGLPNIAEIVAASRFVNFGNYQFRQCWQSSDPLSVRDFRLSADG